MDSIIFYFLDRINRIFRMYFFLVYCHRPVGPTPRRDETKKTKCARGAQGLMAEKFTIIAKPKTQAIYSFLNMVMI